MHSSICVECQLLDVKDVYLELNCFFCVRRVFDEKKEVNNITVMNLQPTFCIVESKAENNGFFKTCMHTNNSVALIVAYWESHVSFNRLNGDDK